MECTNFVDVSETFSYLPSVKGWGTSERPINKFDIIDDAEIDDIIFDTELPGIPSLFTVKDFEHLKFNHVDSELGKKLL